jgi:hypothetical protein
MLTTLALTVALLGNPQLIDPPAPGPIMRHLQQTVFQQAPTAAQTGFVQAGSGDSVTNGAVIGAVIGGAALGLSTVYLCYVTEGPCWSEVPLWASIGAGVGALIGAGVDALFQRRVTVRVPIKF